MKYFYIAYALISYVVFLATFVYAIAFVGNFFVVKTVDTPGTTTPLVEAIAINLGLLAVFAIQHSVMARKSFKRRWEKIVPSVIERSTFVLFSSGALILLFWQWRPLGGIVWNLSGTMWEYPLFVLSLFGWLTVLWSTCLLGHFEMFGLKQAYFNLKNKPMVPLEFKTPNLYKYVRHPIYFGFTVAFFATPVMSVSHLLFATVTFAYMLIGIQLEEQDLIDLYGERYREYKNKVSMILPKIG